MLLRTRFLECENYMYFKDEIIEEMINEANNDNNLFDFMIEKMKKTLTSVNIVKSFEKAGITHRSVGDSFTRKSYFVVDTNKIDKDNREIMGIKTSDFVQKQTNKPVKIKLNQYKSLIYQYYFNIN